MNRAASLAAGLAGAGMALVLSGCALWRAEPPPALTSVPVAPDDPALSAALEGWSAVVAERSGLAGGVVLKLSGPQGERRISQNVVLERPARLRMEIQAFLTTAAVLVADGTRYDYFQSIDRYRESGPVHPTLLWEIAGVPLTLDQAVYFLLGGVPPRPGLRPGGGERWSDGRLRVDLHDARGRRARSLWFGAEGRLERAEEWSSDDRLRWQVGYDRYRDVGGQPFAHTIEFEFPRYEAQATVAFRTVELNPDVPDGTFELHLAGDGEGG